LFNAFGDAKRHLARLDMRIKPDYSFVYK
jgi:hypothetical protein